MSLTKLQNGQVETLMKLVERLGIPVALAGVVIWHGWTVADSLREERKEYNIFARTTLTDINKESVKALTLAAEALDENIVQGERLESAITQQIDTNKAVIHSVDELDRAVDELNEHNTP